MSLSDRFTTMALEREISDYPGQGPTDASRRVPDDHPFTTERRAVELFPFLHRARAAASRTAGLDAEFAEYLEFKRRREEMAAAGQAEGAWKPVLTRDELRQQARERYETASSTRPSARWAASSRPEPRYTASSRPEPRYAASGASSRPEPRWTASAAGSGEGFSAGEAGRFRREGPSYGAGHARSLVSSGPTGAKPARTGAGAASSLIPESITIPWEALTPCMPGLHIRTVPDEFDCEDIGASLLVHWGVPASVTVYRRVELLYADTKTPVMDRFGVPVHRHRWRRVDYDLSGEPQRAILSVMTQFSSSGVRESRSFDYDHERKLATAFVNRVVPQLKTADADAATSTPAPKEAKSAGTAEGDDAATVGDETQRPAGQDAAEEEEAGEAAEDEEEAGEAAEDEEEAGEAAEGEEEAGEATEQADEDTSRLAWGCAELVHDNVIYRPVGKNFAIMRMHKWHPRTEGVRYEILQDHRVSLTVESNPETAANVPGQRPWTFFMVGLGRNVRMD